MLKLELEKFKSLSNICSKLELSTIFFFVSLFWLNRVLIFSGLFNLLIKFELEDNMLDSLVLKKFELLSIEFWLFDSNLLENL